jgi:hypothetical protein
VSTDQEPVQMAAQVDTLVDEGDTESAAPIMKAAAEHILAGRNKWFVWTSGGGLPCPLSAPLCAAKRVQQRTWSPEAAGTSNTTAQQATGTTSSQPCSSSARCQEPDHRPSPDGAACASAPASTDGMDAEEAHPHRSSDACASGVESKQLEPLFLARFDAAWVYAEMATMYVSYLEKKRHYSEACTVLRALLGGSVCPLRRCCWPL